MFWAGSGGRWKDAHQHDVYCQDGGGRAAALAGKGPGYTSPQQHQHQSSGAAPCADGLAWGFHGEGSDEGSNPGHKDSFIDKLGVKSPAMYSSQDLRDDGAVGDFAPVSTTDTVRCNAIGCSPESSLTSVAPSLAMLAYRSGLSDQGGQEGEHPPRTFSSVDESLEQDEEESSPTTADQACGFSSFHLMDVGGSGAEKRRRWQQQQEEKYNEKYRRDCNDANGETEHLVPFSAMHEPMLLAPFDSENNSNGGAEGLQGLSPGPGQDTYAAKFRSPCPYPLQNKPHSVMAADRSMGSIFDATSPSSWVEGGVGSSSFLSPGALSINTASSLYQGDEGETTRSERHVGAWDKDTETGREGIEEKEEERQKKEQEEKVGEHEERKQEDKGEMEGEVREMEQHFEGRTPGESKTKEQDLMEEKCRGNREGSEHHASGLLEEKAMRANMNLLAAAGTAGGVAQGSPTRGHGKGSATSLVLGMNVKANSGAIPASDVSSESWDADNTPRLDDYFRGQASVPPSEGQLLPPPFDGGENGSPLFPSPPLEGRALYGLSTWSFGSDLGGGTSGGGFGANDAALKPSALNHRGRKPTPAESFSYHGGRTKAEAKSVKNGNHRHPQQQQKQQQQQQQHQQQQQQRGTKNASSCAETSTVNGSASVAATNATAARGNPLPRRGRFLVQKSHNHIQQPKRAADVGEEQNGVGRNVTNLNGSKSNHPNNNHNNDVGDIGTGGSVTGGMRRRSSGNGGGGGGGHQKRHQEWLDKFGEDKRMERQEEEAKAQRREAARRRTRDLLLERAKQRLLAIAAAASTASASTSSAAVTGSAGGTASSPQAEPVSIFDGCSHRAQANPPAVAGESDDGAGVKGEGAAAAASFLPARDGAGGAGAAAAVAAVAAAAALSAGIPLYAQETWAARHSKVERKGSEADVTPEEKERLEKEKFERIAATRRRQKEHHKRFLAALKAKRVQEEEDRLLQERKEAEKRCNIKMWAERRLQKHQTQKASSEHCSPAEAAIARKSPEGDGTEANEASGDDGGNSGVAGSGLNAIRKAHSRSEEQEGGGGAGEMSLAPAAEIKNGVVFLPASVAATSNITTSDEIEKAAKVAEGLDKEERRRRSFEIKLAREKAQRYLESLVRKKREKEDEEANAKRRQAKRMRLLRDKVLSMAKELRQNGNGNVTEAAQHRGAGAESSEEERAPGSNNNNNNNNNQHVDGSTIAGSKAPSRLTDEELQASVERLTQQRKGGGVVTASARDFNDWKRKHRVAPETKVFVMTGWYPCVKRALIDRGWVQNTDRDSPFFDLKWTLHSQDIRTTDIEPWQLCNHFFKNVAITTKAGLLGNLRNLKWFADCDCGDILPRGYDLSVETDVLAFLDDYCATAAESLLKHVLLRAKGRVALRRVGISTCSAQSQEPRAVSDAADSKSEEEDAGHGDGDSKGCDDEVMFCLEKDDGDQATVGRGEEAETPPLVIERDIHSSDGKDDGKDDGDDEFDDSSDEEDDQGEHLAAAAASSTPAIVPGLSVAVDSTESAESAPTATQEGPPPPTDRAKEDPREQQQQGEERRRRQRQAPGVLETSSAAQHNAEMLTATPEVLLSRAGVPNILAKGKGRGNIATGGQGSDAQAATDAGRDGDDVQSSRGGKPRREAPPVSARRRQWEPEGAGIHINAEILGAALAVCRRRHAPVGQGEGELDSGGPEEVLCTELEWELIGLGTGGGAPHPDMPGLYRPHFLSSRPATPLEAFIQTQSAEKDAPSSRGAREERRRQKQQDDTRAACAERVRTIVPLGGALLEQVEAVLERAAMASRSQFDLNGDFCQNMWIVKPAAKSRGRGIECFTELDKLLSYTESKQPQAVSQWVVHKYIENPLIIARRKFDMRQWVLVTDWNPLTIWFYDRCYVRFGVEEYTTSGSNIGNNFVHLVNNSICKKSDNFGQVSTTDNGIEVHEHMWSNEVFAAYVDEVAGEGCWRKKMQPRMEQIVTWSLLCAQDLVEHRKNSWELYGYDFMVDDQYKPWLIEINSSPACDYSTKVTEQYVQAALTDLLKVTVDLPEWEASHKKSSRAPQPQQKPQQQQQEGVSAPVATADDTVFTKGEQQDVSARSVGVATATITLAQQEKGKAESSAPGDNRGSTGGSSSLEGPNNSSSAGSAGISDVPEKKESPEDGRPAGTEGETRGGQGGNPPDTGLWRLLYKGAFVPFPVASFGTDLALKGTRIPNGKQRVRPSPHTVKI